MSLNIIIWSRNMDNEKTTREKCVSFQNVDIKKNWTCAMDGKEKLIKKCTTARNEKRTTQ